MATRKQKAAARRNIKHAIAANRKHHHRHKRRRNPAGAAGVARAIRALSARGGMARAGRVLIVR